MLDSVIVKKKSQRFLDRKHPWIFSGALHDTNGLKEGQVVKVLDEKEEILATGHYHGGSIAVRILSFKDEIIDYDFYYARLKEAWKLRRALDLAESLVTNAFRWVNGEGDYLPGLIVDVYNNIAVIQCHSYGMYLHRKLISDAIARIANATIKHIFVNVTFRKHADMEGEVRPELIKGSKVKTTISENNFQFDVDVAKGQKTGFFLDQRENRSLLTQYVHNKNVLNGFAYTGGFSIYAAKSGAKSVTSIDISQEAVSLCRENSVLNGIDSNKHHVLKRDVMDYLKENTNKYDVVVLDPPAFAKSQNKRHNAVQAYKKLNANGISAVTEGGFLFTFSCSQVVSKELFKNTIIAAAIESERNIKIIKSLSQSSDHPVNIYHQEGSYLKGLLLQVL